MKNAWFALVGAMVLLTSCDPSGSSKEVELNDQLDSVSYAIGLDQGIYLSKGLENFPDTLNVDALIEGFVHSMKNGEVRFDDEKGKAIISSFMMAKQEEEKQKQKEKFAGNEQLGKDFLEKNAEEPEVVVTPSGLQYKVITQGTGEKPIDGDQVRVHYEGTLIDGRVFDSSYERGEPIVFGLNQVIAGWTEGLKLMPEGSTYMLYIPQELAYGANPRPGSIIEPYATLIFKVELIEIMK
jgi:FKBP-type peptidyl-prolyl cis-trans isomerase